MAKWGSKPAAGCNCRISVVVMEEHGPTGRTRISSPCTISLHVGRDSGRCAVCGWCVDGVRAKSGSRLPAGADTEPRTQSRAKAARGTACRHVDDYGRQLRNTLELATGTSGIRGESLPARLTVAAQVRLFRPPAPARAGQACRGGVVRVPDALRPRARADTSTPRTRGTVRIRSID
jgi:hypothetical protein